MNFLPYISTVVAFAFTIAIYNRYRQRGGKHLLLWAFGMLLYGIGTLSEVILGFRFNEFVLKLWYLTGAMLTAAWLGQGTVFLLVRRHGVARGLLIGLTVVSLAAAVLVFIAPVTAAAASYMVSEPIS